MKIYYTKNGFPFTPTDLTNESRFIDLCNMYLQERIHQKINQEFLHQLRQEGLLNPCVKTDTFVPNDYIMKAQTDSGSVFYYSRPQITIVFQLLKIYPNLHKLMHMNIENIEKVQEGQNINVLKSKRNVYSEFLTKYTKFVLIYYKTKMLIQKFTDKVEAERNDMLNLSNSDDDYPYETEFSKEYYSLRNLYFSKSKSEELLNKCNLTKDELESVFYTLLGFGSLANLDTKFKWAYVKCINNEVLTKADYMYFLASWGLFHLNRLNGLKIQHTIQTKLLNLHKRYVCPICKNTYVPKRINNKTCGDKECQKEYKKRYIKEQRRIGRYTHWKK